MAPSLPLIVLAGAICALLVVLLVVSSDAIPWACLLAVVPWPVFFLIAYALGERDRRFFQRRGAHGLCINCGYDLRGNTSGVCPECGTRFGPPKR